MQVFIRIFTLAILIFISKQTFSQDCPPVVSMVNNGPVQIVIYSAEGECFKAKLINQYLFPDFCNQVTFLESVGMKKIKVELESGEIIEKNIAIADSYAKATFEIRKNKKDQYVLKLLPFQVETNGPTAAELMEQAEADRKAFVAKSEAESAAAKQAKEDKKAKEAADLLAQEKAIEDKKIADEKAALAAEKAKNTPKETSSSSTNSSSSNSSSTSGEGITLKISNGGSPAVDWEIAIECACTTKGWGVTDNNGVVFIPSSNISSKNINVYGVKGNNKFRLEGVIVLNSNNYVEIDPTQAAKMMNDKIKQYEQMDDMSDEEIMNSFGF